VAVSQRGSWRASELTIILRVSSPDFQAGDETQCLADRKQYPQYRAVTYSHAGDVRQATGVAFNPLFQHISNNQIAMTTPVEARYTAIPGQIDVPQVEVSFLYPAPNIAPSSVNSAVTVTDTPPTWESYEKNLQKLEDWLKEHPEYAIVGPPRRLFYNSPMTPEAIKISEVQIPIDISNK